MTDVTRDEIIAEIWAIIQPEEPGPEWRSIAQIMAEHPDKKPDTVRGWIEKAVKEGRMEKYQPNRNKAAYYKVKHGA